MNSLSWFIYLTQVVHNMSSFSAVALIVGAVIGGFSILFMPMILDTIDVELPVWKVVKYYIGTMCFLFLIFVLTPSRQTMVLIAGSEIGERVAKSGDVQGIVNPGLDLIKKWIKSESDKIKEKS